MRRRFGSRRNGTNNTTIDRAFVARNKGAVTGDYVRVSVSDTGEGMPPEVAEKVFEPFFTTKEVGKGTGLGLSMVYGFVKQTGGYVAIDSEVGNGTTVNLYFPRSGEMATADKIEGSLGNASPGSERILIVEDQEQVRNIAVDILEAQGYDIVAARDGAEAVKRLREEPTFDLLFTDIVLPGGMSGVEVAAEAKRVQPGIKLIYATGHADNSVLDAAHSDSNTVVLNKPYRRIEFLEIINALLESRAA